MAQTTFSGPVVSQNGFIDSSFTNAERDAIVNPQPGLLIYNTDENTYQVYTGSTWESAFSGGGGGGGWPFYANLQGQVSSIISGTPFYGPIVFTPDGTSFVAYGDEGAAGFKLIKVNVLVPYEVTTYTSATYMSNSGTYSVTGQNIIGGYFNGDGTIFFSVFNLGGGSVQILPCFLFTPYDVTTGVFGNSSSVGIAMTAYNFTGFSISPDGTNAVFLLNDTMGGQYTGTLSYTLPVAYDLTTWNGGLDVSTDLTPYLSNLFSSQNGAYSRGISFDATGTTVFVTTYATSMINSDTFLAEFKLGTAYDFTTLSNTYTQDLNIPSNNQYELNNSVYNGKLYLAYENMPNSLSIVQYGLTQLAVPNITSVTPSSGGSGTIVDISGSGFIGATSVAFGSTTTTSFSVNPAGTIITVTVPPVAGTVDVSVTNAAGTDTKVNAYTSTASVQNFTNGVDGNFASMTAFMSSNLFITNPSTALVNATAASSASSKTAVLDFGGGQVWNTYVSFSDSSPGSYANLYFTNMCPFTGTPQTVALIG